MRHFEVVLGKAIRGEFLTHEEGIELYLNTPDALLFYSAHQLRKKFFPGNRVGWIIDRNINITNICFSFCKFCNFCRKSADEDAYITSIEDYRTKIRELYSLGGKQLLLQGGMHPRLGLEFYTDLFRQLKEEFPDLRLHALGPPEIVHLSRMENSSYSEILTALRESGMDSLPGAGAEILVDSIRHEVSPSKCSAEEWLEVMRIAHLLNFPTSWPFMDRGTILRDKDGIKADYSPRSYLRLIAISRLLLPNIGHIQASWLTVGKETGQLCLHAGADDFGSIMIEENVVSSAGADTKMDANGIQQAIIEAGFEPYQRNQLFEKLN